MNDHTHPDPQRGKGAGRLLRGDPRPLANRRMGLPELVDRRRLDRAARQALDDAGWTAPTVVVAAALAGQDLKSDEIMSALDIVGELRGQHDGLPTEEEIAMVVSEATTETRAAILELLREDPSLSSEELWERCQGRGLKLTAKSSFTGVHCTWARRQLGIDGTKEMAKRMTVTDRTSARQPSEEASPPEASPPPPAAPVAEDGGPLVSEEIGPPEDDECPKGDPDCLAPDDGEWHSHEACESPEGGVLENLDQEIHTPPSSPFEAAALAIQAELLKVEQRVRELKIALDVVEGLVA